MSGIKGEGAVVGRLSCLLLLGMLQVVACSSSGETETAVPASVESSAATQALTVCSFKIQFLGNSNDRDDPALAQAVKDCDIVAVQELVSPPYPATFPGGDAVNPDAQSAEFFDAMTELGFEYWLSEEDTGTGDTIHRNGSSTEWWVTFYKDEKVSKADNLPHGFLAEDRSNHDDYERVPFAFAFRTPDSMLDFVLISVHLQPGSGPADRARRKHELFAIATWIDNHDDTEKDFIILGDMNLYTTTEIVDVTPQGYLSLNDEARPTNTNVSGPEPYDHVMYSTTDTTEIDTVFDMEVIDLIEDMRPFWDEANGDYPGDPYDHNAFRGYYSDHHPVVFKLNIPNADDDFGNSGKLQGGVTFSGGRVGLAFHFDGVDGFVEIPHDANLDGFTQATIAAWINLDSIRGRQAILSKVPAGNYYLLVDGDRLSFENNQIAFGAFKGSTSLTSSLGIMWPPPGTASKRSFM